MPKSVMRHQFSEVPSAQIPRSTFNRSHGLKTTFDAGYLVPILVDEALPGDTFNLKMTAFGRLATPIKPIMDNLFLETFFFAIPNRLVWENWEEFMGEQEDPAVPVTRVVPMADTGPNGAPNGSLENYMGIPDVPDLMYSALPGRAYQLVWNEWFRDQNLTKKADIPTDDTASSGNEIVRLRGKRHDYFTSCLPWPQKGPEVPIAGLTQAPVLGLGVGLTATQKSNSVAVLEADASDDLDTVQYDWYTDDFDPARNVLLKFPDGTSRIPQLYADLTNAGFTVNGLRESFQLQKMLERDARSGTRYPEVIKAHFGVTSPDARLQRPEFLGGGRSMININSVQQTSESGTTPQGNLAAYGTVSASGHGFVKSFTEHTIIIGIACVFADLTYQRGLDRMWSRSTRFDFYWPALSHLGEQAVLNKEIYAKGSIEPAGTWDEGTFGYQERYAEYRYKNSMITGLFKSSDPASLDVWHLSQDFGDPQPQTDQGPVLNTQFIEEAVPLDRVIAVNTEPHILLDAYFSMRCARPMPLYSVPGMIDHF